MIASPPGKSCSDCVCWRKPSTSFRIVGRRGGAWQINHHDSRILIGRIFAVFTALDRDVSRTPKAVEKVTVLGEFMLNQSKEEVGLCSLFERGK